MERIVREFRARPEQERTWMIENSWCEHCQEADLGITDPMEYEEQGQVYLEGHCRRCGSLVRSEIRETLG
jgi:hypothetical protein